MTEPVTVIREVIAEFIPEDAQITRRKANVALTELTEQVAAKDRVLEACEGQLRLLAPDHYLRGRIRDALSPSVPEQAEPGHVHPGYLRRATGEYVCQGQA